MRGSRAYQLMRACASRNESPGPACRDSTSSGRPPAARPESRRRSVRSAAAPTSPAGRASASAGRAEPVVRALERGDRDPPAEAGGDPHREHRDQRDRLDQWVRRRRARARGRAEPAGDERRQRSRPTNSQSGERAEQRQRQRDGTSGARTQPAHPAWWWPHRELLEVRRRRFVRPVDATLRGPQVPVRERRVVPLRTAAGRQYVHRRRSAAPRPSRGRTGDAGRSRTPPARPRPRCGAR